MIPLRFISKPAELGTTHGLAQLYLRWGGGGEVRDDNGNINEMRGLTEVMGGAVRSQRMEGKVRT